MRFAELLIFCSCITSRMSQKLHDDVFHQYEASNARTVFPPFIADNMCSYQYIKILENHLKKQFKASPVYCKEDLLWPPLKGADK